MNQNTHCWICDKSFSSKRVLKKHVEEFHEIEQSHKSAKAQSAIRVVLKKSGSNHHTMIA